MTRRSARRETAWPITVLRTTTYRVRAATEREARALVDAIERDVNRFVEARSGVSRRRRTRRPGGAR